MSKSEYFANAAKNIYLLSQIPTWEWSMVDEITKEKLEDMPYLLFKQLSGRKDLVNFDILDEIYKKYQERSRRLDEESVKRKLYVGEPGYLEQQLEEKKKAYDKVFQEYSEAEVKYIGEPGGNEYHQLYIRFIKAMNEYIKIRNALEERSIFEKVKQVRENFWKEKQKDIEKEKDLGFDSKDKDLDSKDKDLDSKDLDSKDLDSEDKDLDSEDKDLDSEDKDLDSEDKDLENDYIIYETSFDQVLNNLKGTWKFVENFFDISIDKDKKEITLNRKIPSSTIYTTILISGTKATVEMESGLLSVQFEDEDGGYYDIKDWESEQSDVLIDLDGYFYNLNPSS